VRIGANISGLQRGVQDADRSLGNFSANTSKRFDDLKNRLDGFVSGFAPLSIAAGGALGYGIKVASDFESVLAEVEARTGATAEEMDELRGVALRMGAETVFSSQQAAEAMLQLLTSGASAEEAVGMLPAVLDAAAASGENLGRTADAVTDIMASFQLGVEDSAGVAESLARASGSSSATMGNLIDAFVNGGSAASAYGLSVNRSSAILALFAERGVKGAEAGTLLKSMLQGMDRQTDSVRNAWRQLGTSMYDTEGNMRDFAVVIEEIKLGLAGMTMEEQNIVLQELAGTYGIAGLRALTTGQSIGEMEARMAGAASVTDVAQARMETFAGRLDSLRGSVYGQCFDADGGRPDAGHQRHQ
jgi:TP901 family phage tail tape measure protein